MIVPSPSPEALEAVSDVVARLTREVIGPIEGGNVATETNKNPRLIDDPKVRTYSIKDQGFTGLVYGETGAGKTLAVRRLIKELGADNVLVIATDPRLAPLDGIGAKIVPCWVEPGLTGVDLKNKATQAWERLEAIHRDLIAAAANPGVVLPKAVVHDNLSNTGDILMWSIAKPGGQLSQPDWGTLARRVFETVTLYRGLQVRGLMRIINCTSGIATDASGRVISDAFGRAQPQLMIGTGGKLAPKHVPRKVDYQFYVDARYEPGHDDAGADGMVRQFTTCQQGAIVAKGSPQLPTPTMKACWWEVYKLVMGGADE